VVHLQLLFSELFFTPNFPLIFSYPAILFAHNAHMIISSWIPTLLWHDLSRRDVCNASSPKTKL